MKITLHILEDFTIDEINVVKYALEHYILKEDRYEIVSFVHDLANNEVHITLELSTGEFSQEDFIRFIMEKCKVHYEYRLNNNVLTLDDRLILINIFKKLDRNYELNFDETEVNDLYKRKKDIKKDQINAINEILQKYVKKTNELQIAKEKEINEVVRKYGYLLEDIDNQISKILNI